MTSAAESMAVVLVNFRAAPLVTERALALQRAEIRVIVADNSGEIRHPELSVVDCGGNVGFGAACNRAIETCDDEVEVVCLHNPDVVAAPADLCHLASMLKPGDGAVAPAVRTRGTIRERGYHYPGFVREGYLTLRHSVDGVRRGHTSGSNPAVRRGHGRRFGTAACLVARRDALEAVDGFDERYFLYGEDLDLWHRLGARGFRTRFEPATIVEHVGGAGSSMASPDRELHRWLGVELFVQLHRGPSWHGYRTIHRRALDRLGARAELVAVVRAAWAAGLTPVEVAERARPELRSFSSG
jgi:N-acetylglucosaminyl-diphospho-decaprenol L-rhamnosyltransferase